MRGDGGDGHTVSPTLDTLVCSSTLSLMSVPRALSLGLLAATVAGAGDIRPDPWQLGLAYSFNEAEREFAHVLRDRPRDRDAQLGRAAALLNVQPRTADRITAARDLLESIAAENRSDAAGISARYLLARIADAHQQPRDPALAAQIYRSLLDENTAHPLAQAAGVKLALILLYDTAQPDLAARFAATEALLTQVTQAGPRSDLLVVLGRSALHFRRPPRDALRWFAAARETGFALRSVASDTLVALSDLAIEHGETALARDCLTEFVETYPRDSRSAWLGRRLADLPPGD